MAEIRALETRLTDKILKWVIGAMGLQTVTIIGALVTLMRH
jgi:hypothetical protein